MQIDRPEWFRLSPPGQLLSRQASEPGGRGESRTDFHSPNEWPNPFAFGTEDLRIHVIRQHIRVGTCIDRSPVQLAYRSTLPLTEQSIP